MDIEFVEPAEAPLPPDQMSFRSVEVEPFPDRRRLGIRLSVTPFLSRPSIDLEVSDAKGVKVASSSIIEATETEMSVTLHLRQQAESDRYRLTARLHYPEPGQVDLQQREFDFPRQDTG